MRTFGLTTVTGFVSPHVVRGHRNRLTSLFSDCPQTPSKPVDFPGFTPQAQRIINYFAGGGGNAQSENCLTLNIWTKSTDDCKKPVLVFFHGGRACHRTSSMCQC